MERRRAEEFAQLLDLDVSTHPHLRDSAHASGASSETDELMGVTEQLGDLRTQLMAASEPSADWQDATRRRLMAVAAEEGIGATARHRASAAVPTSHRAPVLDEMFPRRPRGGRRLAIVAALLTGTVAVSGVSAASGDALPGETLYNVKRSAERAQLALAGNDIGRAQLHLEFARTRIAEASQVSGDDEAAADALTDAAGNLREGVALLGQLAVTSDDPSPLDYIDQFTNEHRWVLDDLVANLDGDAGAVVDELAVLIDDAAVRSVELREALPCTELGGESDSLGPVPGNCATHDTVESAEPESQGPGDVSMEPSESGTDSSGSGSNSSPGEESTQSGNETGQNLDGAGNSPVDNAVTSQPSDPASGGATDDSEDDDDVLGELTGVVSDLFN
ncbi:DUF5667 domain-containing protein [Glycomyces buryatensis]|uniref:DUF5667 domain-containing protein n=1 Tax=Glycomyces buryatensis TaxID=2570927 RepID=A0A4S8QEA2_9ACTN|nr:DUF5667 domain-containing protein [Glycomyces buryatensis]THV41235.1 hypothetical protein FAB82_12445 [Glycomyces buryatensis]